MCRCSFPLVCHPLSLFPPGVPALLRRGIRDLLAETPDPCPVYDRAVLTSLCFSEDRKAGAKRFGNRNIKEEKLVFDRKTLQIQPWRTPPGIRENSWDTYSFLSPRVFSSIAPSPVHATFMWEGGGRWELPPHFRLLSPLSVFLIRDFPMHLIHDL